MENTNVKKKRVKFYKKYTEVFEPTKEFKEEFLRVAKEWVDNGAFNPHRLQALKNLMRKVARWENIYGKDVYDFSTEELKGMLKEFNSKSTLSLMSQKSNLEQYLGFAKARKEGNLNVPSTISLSAEDMEQMVNKIGAENRYINREELYDIIDPIWDDSNKDELISGIANPQDRLSFLLIFNGIMGKENEDLINLKWKDANFENNTIIVRDKKIYTQEKVIHLGDITIQLDEYTMNVIRETIDENTYYFNNAKLHELKDGTIKHRTANLLDKYDSDYLFRPVEYRDEDGSKKVTGQLIQRRFLQNCKEVLDKPHLTLATLYVSGLVDRAIEYTDEVHNGEMMKNKDFQEFLKVNNARVNLHDSFYLYKSMWEEREKQREKEKEEE